MVWFHSGSIPEAIAESRKQLKLFVVYISGDDDNSRKMDQMWEDERAQQMCGSACIALKLEDKSEGCKQFSAIYPVLCIPSAYFIDNKGKIVEALTLQDTVDDFINKMRNVTQSYGAKTSDAAGTSNQPDEDKASMTHESRNGALGEKEQRSEARSIPKIPEKQEKKRHSDAEEMKDEARQELERREWGKSVKNLKETQQDAKRKQDIEERKTMKMEEKAAKERVRRQIEQDKIDRAARYQQEKAERAQAVAKDQHERQKTEEQEMKKEHEKKNSLARLQFRMPDGSTLVQQFEATDVFRSAVDFVISQNFPLFTSSDSFELSVAFPRRVFSLSDHERSFRDLQLTPSVSLVVLPRHNRNTVVPSTSSPASQLWSFLIFVLMIPVQLLQYIWSFIAGSSAGQQQVSSTHQGESIATPAERAPRSMKSTTETRRRGNMTRLRDVKHDDDDNSTWNGNSTQQM